MATPHGGPQILPWVYKHLYIEKDSFGVVRLNDCVTDVVGLTAIWGSENTVTFQVPQWCPTNTKHCRTDDDANECK